MSIVWVRAGTARNKMGKCPARTLTRKQTVAGKEVEEIVWVSREKPRRHDSDAGKLAKFVSKIV